MSLTFGRGRLRWLTARLPHPHARAVSDAMQRACGCRLAYHKRRRTYVVYRDRGPHTPPRTYMDLDRPSYHDIPKVEEAARAADAVSSGSLGTLLRQYNRRHATTMEGERNDLIEDFLPDLCKDMRRIHEVFTDGRVSTKYSIPTGTLISTE